MGARALIESRSKPHTSRKRLQQQSIVDAVVAVNGGLMTTRQERALGTALHAGREALKGMIETAQERLAAHTGFYVDAHKQAVEDALTLGDAKALEVAARATQWAMEHISLDGKRVVEAASSTPSGTKIFIGVQLGGQNHKAIDVESEVVEGQVD